MRLNHSGRRMAAACAILGMLTAGGGKAGEPPGETRLTDFWSGLPDADWGPALREAVSVAGRGGIVNILPGEYRLRSRVDLDGDITLRFSRGAALVGSGEGRLRIRAGRVLIEGHGGRGEIRGEAGPVVELVPGRPDARPSLEIRRMILEGDGILEAGPGPGPGGPGELGEVILDGNRIVARNTAIRLSGAARIERVLVADCDFEPAGESHLPGGIEIAGGAIPGGVLIRNNSFDRAGRILLHIRGDSRGLPMAWIHGNRIRGGSSAGAVPEEGAPIRIEARAVSILGNTFLDLAGNGADGGTIVEIRARDGLVAGNLFVDAGGPNPIRILDPDNGPARVRVPDLSGPAPDERSAVAPKPGLPEPRSPILVGDEAELPEPTLERRGRLAVIAGPGGDSLRICLVGPDGEPAWVPVPIPGNNP